jgi:hypothetical protein
MCGDTCCPSCGPAQGNSRCGICGEWASEGCIHYDEETNDYKPEFKAKAEEMAKREAEEMNQWYEEMHRWEREEEDK